MQVVAQNRLARKCGTKSVNALLCIVTNLSAMKILAVAAGF